MREPGAAAGATTVREHGWQARAMNTPSSAELRAWALENGHPVAARGRVSNDVRTAWLSAQTRVRRKRRPASLPVRSGGPPTAESSHATSADEELSAAAVLSEQLAALTQRVDELEMRLASKAKKKRNKKSR